MLSAVWSRTSTQKAFGGVSQELLKPAITWMPESLTNPFTDLPSITQGLARCRCFKEQKMSAQHTRKPASAKTSSPFNPRQSLAPKFPAEKAPGSAGGGALGTLVKACAPCSGSADLSNPHCPSARSPPTRRGQSLGQLQTLASPALEEPFGFHSIKHAARPSLSQTPLPPLSRRFPQQRGLTPCTRHYPGSCPCLPPVACNWHLNRSHTSQLRSPFTRSPGCCPAPSPASRLLRSEPQRLSHHKLPWSAGSLGTCLLRITGE